MTDASTEDEIDHLFDKPVNAAILNGYGWSIIQPIVPANKLSFLQHLIQDEVIIKRERNLKAFQRGLNVLGVGDLLKRYPCITDKLFVAQKSPLSPAGFLDLVSSLRPQRQEEVQAFEIFKEFVSYLEGQYHNCSIDLYNLQFWQLLDLSTVNSLVRVWL